MSVKQNFILGVINSSKVSEVNDIMISFPDMLLMPRIPLPICILANSQ